MASQNDSRLISDQYAVTLTAPLPDAAGGLTAFAATDRLSAGADVMAVAVQRRAPARARALEALTGLYDSLLAPLAHGIGPGPSGEAGYYVISAKPPGPSLAATLRPWDDRSIIELVLRPAALVLQRLHPVGVTHRAIRLDNVFQSRPGQPVVLGHAWAAPPAMHQLAQYEPPYSAMCIPAGRGDGTIADDVYALGALLLALSLGQLPLADLDPALIVRRKVDMGSFQALAGDVRLSPIISDLARGMLAEDPDHRPTPAMLLDPAAARSRRVAARPPRRAQRALPFAGQSVWDARSLAYAVATEPAQALSAMTAGTVTQWLRRGLGDAALGSRIEELIRHRQNEGADERGADAFLILRAIVLLDPLAPLCWRGIAFWPDGIGSALAASLGIDTNVVVRLEEVIQTEAISSWAMLRSERSDFVAAKASARQYRGLAQIRGAGGGLPRLVYFLCPLLPCASPMLVRHWVARVADMPSALEAVAAVVDHATSPVDVHIAAFLAARSERRLENETNGLNGSSDGDGVALARLRLLAQLQLRYDQRPLPGLAAWVAEHLQPLVDSWNNRPRRAALAEKARAMAQAGFLPPMVGLFEDAAARAEDVQGFQQAAENVARIDAELAHLARSGDERGRAAKRIGQEIAAGAGLFALASVLVLATIR
jgi:hypothetical protein